MAADGAVEPGPPAAVAAPSSAPARAPASGRLFRPISAEDEEQQPTEIESLCMNCFRNVSWGRGRGQGRAEAGRGGGSATRPGGPSWGPGGEARPGVSGRGAGVSLVLSLAAFSFPRA